LVYFANAAISSAVNARHERVEEGDVLSGEQSYSQFAFEALLVENGITVSELEDVLLEFAGEQGVVSQERVDVLIGRVISDHGTAQYVRERLIALSVLGIEIRDGEFEFMEFEPDDKRGAALARKVAERRGGPLRYAINPAYHAYLEVVES
jgi:hypothetical protein